MALYTAENESLPKINPAVFKRRSCFKRLQEVLLVSISSLGLQTKCHLSTVRVREDLESHRNISVETHNASNNPNWVQVSCYLLTIWRHRMCAVQRRGLGCQTLHRTITKPNLNTVLYYVIIVFAIIIVKQQEVLTDSTTSLASSALHLKGLSQQEMFLLIKKVNYIYIVCYICTSHTHTPQGFYLHQLTSRSLHYLSASALVPSSAHGWT